MTTEWDDSNWREEQKAFTSNKRHLELLENGPKSLSQSWILHSLHQQWMISNVYKYPDTENKGQLKSSFKEWNDGTKV